MSTTRGLDHHQGIGGCGPSECLPVAAAQVIAEGILQFERGEAPTGLVERQRGY